MHVVPESVVRAGFAGAELDVSVLTWGVPLSVSYHFAFSYYSWGSQGRIMKWFAIPFSSGPHSVRPLHHSHPSWVAPWAWLSFIELDQAVVRVIRLTSLL